MTDGRALMLEESVRQRPKDAKKKEVRQEGKLTGHRQVRIEGKYEFIKHL